MARRAVLTAGLALAVIAAHLGVLEWASRRLAWSPGLQRLADPMFTRMLQPEAPPPAPVLGPNRAPGRMEIARGAIDSIAITPAPTRPKRTLTQPEPAVDAAAEVSPTAVEAPALAAAPSPDPLAAAPSPQAASITEPPSPPPEAAAASAVAALAASAPTASASAPATRPLDTWPVDTRLSYRLGGNFRGELHGSARVQWQRVGPLYETRVEVDIGFLASLAMTSQGDVTPEGLRPRAYVEQRRKGPRGVKLRDSDIQFNDGRVVPRPEGGVQDTASQFVELAHRFATGREALEVGRTVSFWMARPGAVDLWTYDIVEKETLRTPTLGAVEAFHLKPRPIANPRGNITAEMWFAPSLQYLPVRIKVNMGEEAWVDLLVEKIEQR